MTEKTEENKRGPQINISLGLIEKRKVNQLLDAAKENIDPKLSLSKMCISIVLAYGEKWIRDNTPKI